MSEPQTWRELLGKILSDPQERIRIATLLNTSQVTLQRWARNEATPSPRRLQQLLSIVPDLLHLLEQEFPEMSAMTANLVEESPEIPSQFYASVMHAFTSASAPLRFWSICKLVLQQALQQLDPYRMGMALVVMACTTPEPHKKVRSLHGIHGQGTPPWMESWNHWPYFLGQESLCGYVVSQGRPTTVQDIYSDRLYFPVRRFNSVRSASATPISRANAIAGCLVCYSTQLDYFTQARVALIQRYAEMIALAFDTSDFYSLEQIELGLMPLQAIQEAYFARYRQRQATLLRENPLLLNNRLADQEIWRQIEEELIRHSMPPSKQDTKQEDGNT